MGNVYLLVKIGECYPKSAMDYDRDMYIDLGDKLESERATNIMKDFLSNLPKIRSIPFERIR